MPAVYSSFLVVLRLVSLRACCICVHASERYCNAAFTSSGSEQTASSMWLPYRFLSRPDRAVDRECRKAGLHSGGAGGHDGQERRNPTPFLSKGAGLVGDRISRGQSRSLLRAISAVKNVAL